MKNFLFPIHIINIYWGVLFPKSIFLLLLLGILLFYLFLSEMDFPF